MTGLSAGEVRARVEGNDLPNTKFIQYHTAWEEVDPIVDSL